MKESSSPSSRSWINAYAVALTFGFALACGLSFVGQPCPGVDDAVYKSPAAELVEHGRLAIPCMRGFLPDADEVFACYPPLYSLLLSLWYWFFGVSLRSSLAFSYSVHLLGALGIMEVTRHLLRDARTSTAKPPLPASVDRAIVLAIGLIQVVNLAYFDRTEETALLWIWLEILTAPILAKLLVARQSGRDEEGRLWRRTSLGASVLTAAFSGFLVAIAGLTAPWVGILGILVLTIRTVASVLQADRPQRWPARFDAVAHLLTAAIVVLCMVGAWYAVMETIQPGAVGQQFSITLQFLTKTQGSDPLGHRLLVFFQTLGFNWPQLPASMIALWLPVAVFRRGRSWMSPTGWAVYGAAVAGILLVAVLRPYAYTYLGASLILLLPCLGPTILHYWQSPPYSAHWGPTLLGTCMVVAFSMPGLLALSAWRSPLIARPDAAYLRLSQLIPPGESVAVMAPHWYVFQGRNPWREAYFASLTDSREVAGCRWLVLPAEIADRCPPSFLDEFAFVERTADDPFYSRASYGYALWHHRDKTQETTGQDK